MKSKKIKGLLLCIAALSACGMSFAEQPTEFRCTSGLVNAATFVIFTPLQQAVMREDEALALELINEGADVNEVGIKRSVTGVDQPGKTALESAAVRNSVVMTELLIGADADVNLKGHYPLLSAARLGHVEVAALILDAGADPNVRDESGQSALDFATRNGDDEMVELLADAGALNRFPRRNLSQVF